MTIKDIVRKNEKYLKELMESISEGYIKKDADIYVLRDKSITDKFGNHPIINYGYDMSQEFVDSLYDEEKELYYNFNSKCEKIKASSAMVEMSKVVCFYKNATN